MPLHLTRFNPQDAGTSGYWGPVTASLDWCEANYALSHYIAEMANTFTNLVFIWLAWVGYTRARRERLSPDIPLLWIGLLAVGLGSFAFHATLRYEWQLADELPMVWASTNLCYCALTAGSSWPGLASLLFAYDVVVSLVYVFVFRDPRFHQTAYGLTVAVLVFRQLYLVLYRLRDSPEEARANAAARKTAYIGLAMYLSGFASGRLTSCGLWNIDNELCVPLTRLKERLGLPAALGLELHAHWHVLTGAGSHWGAVAVAMLSSCLNEGADKFAIRHAYGFVPYVKRLRDKSQ